MTLNLRFQLPEPPADILGATLSPQYVTSNRYQHMCILLSDISVAAVVRRSVAQCVDMQATGLRIAGNSQNHQYRK